MIAWLARRLLGSKIACALVVLVTLGLAALSVRTALLVGQDDDLLAFLPADNPQVVQFRDIAQRFGSLDVAIVALSIDDPFAPDFIEKLGTVTRKLNAEEDIAFAMSLNNVEDFSADAKGGITTRYLLREPPKDEAEKKALAELVMSKRHIVGNLIGPDGKSVIVYVFLAPGANPRASAGMVRKHVTETFPDTPTYWGGAPFISTYIYDVTQRDMSRLIPWAVVLIIVIIVASFRDVLGAMLALGSTGIGILYTYGLMGARHVNANIVLSAMPVILFAVGSAYAIHVMVRYYALRADRDAAEAMIETLTQIGPTVLAAGLTTVAGLLSFLAMDIEPMRQFGLYTGLGILFTLILALTFVPAVVRLLGVKARSFEASMYERAVTSFIDSARTHRRAFILGLAIVVALGAGFASRVEARMENAAFFAKGSPPDQAETFMRDNFGGSLFVQLMVEGDMNDPAVLRELMRVADDISLQPHVSSVTHIGVVLSLANEALAGERRLPSTVGQVRFIYRYLAGRPAIEQLLNPDRQHALIVAKIDTDEHEAVETLLDELERITAKEALTSYRIVGRPPASAIAEEDVAEDNSLPVSADDRALLDAQTDRRVGSRVASHLHDFGVNLPRDAVLAALAAAPVEADVAGITHYLENYLTSAESLLDTADHGRAPALAKAYAALGVDPSVDELRKTTRAIMAPVPELSEECQAVANTRRAPAPSDDDDDDDDDDDAGQGDACTSLLEAHEQRIGDADAVADVMATPLNEARRRVGADHAAEILLQRLGVSIPPHDVDEVRRGLAAALLERSPSSGMLAGGDGKMAYQVSGVPVLYRGLSESVTRNQYKSLAMALGLVLLIMVGLFRSLTGGLLAAAPTVVTLLAIYGIMGATGLHLDIGTSMLASIIIGAGVDYAVHLMAAWRGKTPREAGERAAKHAGPAILTNALMVAAGFFVLTLGDAKPLQNVGRLTAAAMLVAGLATFIAVPALSRKQSYGKS